MLRIEPRRRPAATIAIALAIALALGACKRTTPPTDAGTPGVDWKARWKQVQRWARPALSPAPTTLLDQALAEVSRIRGTLLRLRTEYFGKGKRLPRLSVKDFPPEAKQALDKLQAWYREKGGLPHRQDVVDYMGLTYLAVLTSSGASDDPRLEAILYLAHRLREEGDGLLPVSAGSVFADLAIRRVREQGGAPGPAFRRYRPSRGHIFRALAAEAERAVALAGRLGGGKRGRAIVGGRGLTAYVTAAVEAVRRHWTRFLFAVKPLLSSPKRLRAFLDKHDREVRRNKEALVRMVSIAASPAVQRLIERRRRYLAFLSSSPGPARAPDGGPVPRVRGPRSGRSPR